MPRFGDAACDLNVYVYVYVEVRGADWVHLSCHGFTVNDTLAIYQNGHAVGVSAIRLPFCLLRAGLALKVVYMTTDEQQLHAALITQLRVEMAERNWQQKDLAAAMGMDPATLSRYLKGNRGVSMSVFYRMASGLGLSPRELMERVESRII